MNASVIPTCPLPRVTSEFLRDALTSPGVGILTECLDPALTANAYWLARDVFRLPPDVRERYRAPGPAMGGYTPSGIEGVAGYGPDFHREFWDVREPYRFPNRFPAEVPGFADAISVLYLLLRGNVVDRLLPFLGAVCGQPRAYFVDRTRGAHHLFRMSHYPALPIDVLQGRERFPTHRDFGLLTIFIGGAEPGLEFSRDGQWIPLTLSPGTVAVGAGLILRMESGKRVCAYRHRVAPIPHERTSLTFFLEPDPRVLLPNGEYAGEYLARLVQKIRSN
ncbi:isopenicillin N synthase family oxygenase [Candidatus Uhrbacteria bacterium]|nr:isopenicillin N synthase family oxygenase [Candidatus Uhrbacteria bacterium]